MKRGFFRYLFAAIIIAIGIVLILENIGIATLNINNAWLYIYPALFIVFGLKWMIDKLRYKGGSLTFGSFFLIFGMLLMLGRFEIISFVFKDVFKLWPLLIIYFGFMFIGFSKGPTIYVNTGDKGKKNKREWSNTFSIGSHEYNEPNWKVKPMDVSNLAGDFYFDFTKAFIPETEIPISISSLAGDVNILVPENVDMRVYASTKAGDIAVVGQKVDGINRSLSYESANYELAVKKLDITIKLKAGSIRIDYV